MTKHESVVIYSHMLEHARKAVSLVHGRKREDLDADWIASLALVRLLEVIGEAAKRISSEEQTKHPEIPWAQITGLRNRLIHGYDSVDMDILWQIVQHDLPPLITTLEAFDSSAE